MRRHPAVPVICALSLMGCALPRSTPASDAGGTEATGAAQPPRVVVGGPPQTGQRPPFIAVVEALIAAIAEPGATHARELVERHLAPEYRESQPLEGHVARLSEMRDLLGRAELLDVIAETPGERRARVRSGVSGEVYVLRFAVTSDSPPKIAGMALEREQSPDASSAAAAAGPLTRSARREVLAGLYSSLEQMYVSPDTARLITAHLRGREAAGAYDDIGDPVELGRALTADLRAVNGDLHLSVRPAGGGPGGPSTPAPSQGAPRYGFARVERLPGNVGYVEVSGVLGGSDQVFEVATEALRSIGDAEALILDFRENTGAKASPGGSIINFIISHFVAPNTHILDSYFRDRDEIVPVHALAEVPGPRRLEVPIYVLTSPRTASGGEYIAFVLQAQGRATVVGERTAGAGRMVAAAPLPHGFVAGISVTRGWDPRTGKGWEIVGVAPDVKVPAADALEAALRLAAQRRSDGR